MTTGWSPESVLTERESGSSETAFLEPELKKPKLPEKVASCGGTSKGVPTSLIAKQLFRDEESKSTQVQSTINCHFIGGDPSEGSAVSTPNEVDIAEADEIYEALKARLAKHEADEMASKAKALEAIQEVQRKQEAAERRAIEAEITAAAKKAEVARRKAKASTNSSRSRSHAARSDGTVAYDDQYKAEAAILTDSPLKAPRQPTESTVILPVERPGVKSGLTPPVTPRKGGDGNLNQASNKHTPNVLTDDGCAPPITPRKGGDENLQHSSNNHTSNAPTGGGYDATVGAETTPPSSMESNLREELAEMKAALKREEAQRMAIQEEARIRIEQQQGLVALHIEANELRLRQSEAIRQAESSTASQSQRIEMRAEAERLAARLREESQQAVLRSESFHISSAQETVHEVIESAKSEVADRERTMRNILEEQLRYERIKIQEQEDRNKEESLRLEKQRYEAQRQLEMARLEREKEAERNMQLKLIDERERFQKEIAERAKKEVAEEIERLRRAESERIAAAERAESERIAALQREEDVRRMKQEWMQAELTKRLQMCEANERDNGGRGGNTPVDIGRKGSVNAGNGGDDESDGKGRKTSPPITTPASPCPSLNRWARKTPPASSATVTQTVAPVIVYTSARTANGGGGGGPEGPPGTGRGDGNSDGGGNRKGDASDRNRDKRGGPGGGPGGGGGDPGPDGPPGGGPDDAADPRRITVISKQKEAEKITVAPLPTAVNFLRWLRQLADDVAAASTDPDEAYWWIMDILNSTFEELGNPGVGMNNLDAKVKSGVKKIANHGQIASDIDQLTGDLDKRGRILRGRQIVHKIMTNCQIDVKSAHLFGFNDMNKIRLINGDLRGMVSLWETTLARCQVPLDEESILHPMFFKLVERHPPMSEYIGHYKLMDKDDPNRSYQYLLKCAKKVIELEMFDQNREDIQAAIAAGGNPNGKSPKTAAVAETVKENAPALPAEARPEKTKTTGASFDKDDAVARGLCFAFQEGNCKAVGGKCPHGFKHELAKKKRPPTPPRKGRGKGDTSKIPCKFFPQGTCIWGEECPFSHDSKAKADGPAAIAETKEL
jgi:hypothetical protein